MGDLMGVVGGVFDPLVVWMELFAHLSHFVFVLLLLPEAGCLCWDSKGRADLGVGMVLSAC